MTFSSSYYFSLRSLLLLSTLRESYRGSSHNSCGLGGFLSVLYSCVICLCGLIIKNLVHFYKGSSLQIMIPLHSLPMGCVYNFLEYKSCIIHVYRRATSINYVSLLGARVFTTSPFSFILFSSLPLFLSLSLLYSIRTAKESLAVFSPLLLCLITQFIRVKWTVSKFQLEKDERKRWRKGKSLQWCCDVNALI